MGEASRRLALVAGQLQACKGDGPSGSGRVVVVFEPSGATQSTTLVSGPPFEGTKTADCVVKRFKEVHISPFDGPPFSVNKAFRIQ
jgi:hypothetical protein